MSSAFRLRISLALLAVVLWVAIARTESTRRGEVAAAQQVWQEAGIAVRHARADLEVGRESDPVQLRLLIARIFLADGLQAGWFADVPPQRLESEIRNLQSRLDTAERWARDAIVTRPLAWEGPLVLAGTRFLRAWRSRDDSVYRAPERWLEPLGRARELAPGEPEPLRLEAVVRLQAWPGASEAERRATVPILAQAFHDRDTLRILLADWQAAAGDDERFESVLPDLAATWSSLLDLYARDGRWDAYCRVRSRWWSRVLEEGHRQVADAVEQKALGDPSRARGGLLDGIARLPVDRRTAPLFERALIELPSGPVGASTRSRLETWLGWALPLRARGLPSLAPRAFGRIASLGAGSLPPELEAGAWLAAGDEPSARAAEARSDRLWSEEWGPYFLAKATLLSEQGRRAEAQEALAAVHESLRTGWAYRELAHRIGVDTEAPETPESWPGTAWRWRGTEARTDLLLDRELRGLRIAIDDVAGERSGWLLAVDGREDLCTVVVTGETALLHRNLTRGIHWLQGLPATPARVTPGDVSPIGP